MKIDNKLNNILERYSYINKKLSEENPTDSSELVELNKELSSKLADAEKENTVIRDKLAKSNLIADSIANPKVMEQKINEQVSTIFGALSDSTK